MKHALSIIAGELVRRQGAGVLSVVTLPGEGSEVANRPVKFLIWYLP